MDTRTGRVESLDGWNQELGEKEVKKRIKSGRLVTGTAEELRRKSNLLALQHGSKNQRKKYRQTMRKKTGNR